MSIPIDQLTGSPDPTRRDQWGRYLVVPPDGGKPVGYTRVTTIAKALDAGGALAPWKAAMAMTGLIVRRGLRAEWEALLAEHGSAWYSGAAVKKEAKRLIEECAKAGGADDRRAIGSALHSITALVDLGKKPSHLTEETERDVEAYTSTLENAGIRLEPGAVELITVIDSFKVAGTFDRVAHVPGFDLPLIADLKTGENLEYSWNSIAVQLAAYAYGNSLYLQGAKADGSQDLRQPMPPVSREYGLVMWLRQGDARMTLHLVDLRKGWEAFLHSVWARAWRQENVATEYVGQAPTTDTNLTALLEASLEQVSACGRTMVGSGTDTYDPVCELAEGHAGECKSSAAIDQHHLEEPADEQVIVDYQAEVRSWLQERIDTIGAHEQARVELASTWPANVPTLKSSPTHDEAELAAIEALCDRIERRYALPWGPAKPGSHIDAEKVIELFPGSTKQPTTSN